MPPKRVEYLNAKEPTFASYKFIGAKFHSDHNSSLFHVKIRFQNGSWKIKRTKFKYKNMIDNKYENIKPYISISWMGSKILDRGKDTLNPSDMTEYFFHRHCPQRRNKYQVWSCVVDEVVHIAVQLIVVLCSDNKKWKWN